VDYLELRGYNGHAHHVKAVSHGVFKILIDVYIRLATNHGESIWGWVIHDLYGMELGNNY